MLSTEWQTNCSYFESLVEASLYTTVKVFNYFSLPTKDKKGKTEKIIEERL